jgi:hypothetical protein
MAILARPKLNGLGEHWGVGLPGGLVAHNTAERGEHIVSYIDFACGKPVRIVRYIPHEQMDEAMQRVRVELAQPSGYDLLKNNCEVFANKVSGQNPESGQINGLLAMAALGALLYMTAN